MTGRNWLDRRVRWVKAALFVNIGVIAVVMLVNPPFAGQPPVGILVAVAVFILTWTASHFFWLRCPWCRGNLAPTIFGTASWWMGVDQRIGYCPFCGTNLDSQTPELVPTDDHDRYQTTS